MGMAVQQKFRSRRGVGWRDVDEVKPVSEPFLFEAHRPVRLIVLVSPDDENLGAKILNGF